MVSLSVAFASPALIFFSVIVQSTFASGGIVAHWVDGPELLMDVTKRDLGQVFAGEELEQTFLFRNVGTKPLELSQKSALSGRAVEIPYPITALFHSGGRDLLAASAAMRAAPS